MTLSLVPGTGPVAGTSDRVMCSLSEWPATARWMLLLEMIFWQDVLKPNCSVNCQWLWQPLLTLWQPGCSVNCQWLWQPLLTLWQPGCSVNCQWLWQPLLTLWQPGCSVNCQWLWQPLLTLWQPGCACVLQSWHVTVVSDIITDLFQRLSWVQWCGSDVGCEWCGCRTRSFIIQPTHVSRQRQQLQQYGEPADECYWHSWHRQEEEAQKLGALLDWVDQCSVSIVTRTNQYSHRWMMHGHRSIVMTTGNINIW